ncbi:MAG: HgcAB-associated protein [Spirochaetia bacterium]|nr:HgcAB-associated protein [Spirochaetia bacterium]
MKNICESDSCWKIESLVNVDERGQMVLPKELREKAGIKAGDKLALVTWENNGKICCISLVKSDDLLGMVKKTLEPMVSDLIVAT